MNKLLYAKRNPMDLDYAGNYYCKHIMAMTAEKLHSKSDIAMELGHRDAIIDEMKRAITMALSALAVPTERRVEEAVYQLETTLASAKGI